MREEVLSIPTEFPRAPVPAVFMFQPTRYELAVTGERLQEWERLLRERVGLRAELARPGGLPSISFCDGACDCDEV
jgi:hypothetical protein